MAKVTLMQSEEGLKEGLSWVASYYITGRYIHVKDTEKSTLRTIFGVSDQLVHRDRFLNFARAGPDVTY